MVTINGGIDPIFTACDVEQARCVSLKAHYGIRDKFVMYTGGFDHRKNIEGLVTAFASLPANLISEYQLAVVCNATTEAKASISRIAQAAGLANDRIITTGFVPEDDLVDFYRLCDLFVFPSHYEGLGLPLLEAMTCGAPAIASNNSSLPEILGDASALFDSQNQSEITSKMTEFLMSSDRREAARQHGFAQAKKFSWEISAKKAIAAIDERLHSVKTPTRADAKPRLAYISPLKPEKSGIASYSDDLLPYLKTHYTIDLFVNPEVDFSHYTAKGYCIYPIAELVGVAHMYEGRLLYQIGNSEFHVTMAAALQRFPGVVLMHDIATHGLAWVAEDKKLAPPGFILERLVATHGHQLTHLAPTIDWGLGSTEYTAASWIRDSALGLITTSHFARDLLGEVKVPTRVVRLWKELEPQEQQMRQKSKSDARARLGLDDSVFIIASFGSVHKTKRSGEILEGYLLADLPLDSILIFVGGASEIEILDLNARSATYAKPKQFRVSGYASDSVYKDYLDAIDLCVQLRTHSRGETSGAVLDNFARATPVIVSQAGSFVEIDPNAVLTVDEFASPTVIGEALALLATDSGLRERLGARGAQWVAEHCNPRQAAQDMAHFIEKVSHSRDSIASVLHDRLKEEVPYPDKLLQVFVQNALPVPQNTTSEGAEHSFLPARGQISTQGVTSQSAVSIDRNGFVAYGTEAQLAIGIWLIQFDWKSEFAATGSLRFELCQNAGEKIEQSKTVVLDYAPPGAATQTSFLYTVIRCDRYEARCYFEGEGLVSITSVNMTQIS